MKFLPQQPPRAFQVGSQGQITIFDHGKIDLQPNEQVTFVLPQGGEYDVTRKEWGFYATPSLNGRLEQFGLRGVLIKNRGTGRFFVLLVQKEKEVAFEQYCQTENLVAVAWLDSTAALESFEKKARF
ncbi:hypothetical protein EBX31_01255 [bacterium]|nr:hypothetical protein [bacterium]